MRVAYFNMLQVSRSRRLLVEYSVVRTGRDWVGKNTGCATVKHLSECFAEGAALNARHGTNIGQQFQEQLIIMAMKC